MPLFLVAPDKVMRRLFLPLMLLLLFGACASTGVYHRVETGQTLYRISKEYDVSEEAIRRINGIRDPSQLQVGAMLFIPGASQVRSVPATATGRSVQAKPSRTAPTTKKVAKAARPQNISPPTPAKASSPVAIPGQRPKMSRPPVGIKGQKGVFDWPLRGAIHRTFGDKNGNHKGIEIRAPEGTPVLAAAAGRVIYSDTGIRGFGHLVILQHDDDYFTIYGYNRSNLVSSGAYVSRGQKIALSGVPASGGPPRLHFELRRGKTPVNPILYLP